MSATAVATEQLSAVGLISRISDERSRRQILQRETGLQNPDTVRQLCDEVVRLVRADLRQAHKLAKTALWLARRLDDKASIALSCRALGHVYYLKTKHELALDHYNSAIALYSSLDHEVERARTMTAALQSLIYLGRYDLASEWSTQARAIFERHGDRLRLARLDTNVGNMLHRQDRFQEALDLYRRAYDEFDQQGQVLDTAIVLRNMGVCFISLNQFPQALEIYDRARDFCIRQNAPLLQAEVEYNVAYLYYLRGEYARAIDCYELTRELCKRAGDPYHRALCDLDQAEMRLELNMSSEGARLAESARMGFRKLRMRYENAKATAFAGLAAHQMGRHTQALKLFAGAREQFAKEQNQLWPAMLDLYRGVVLYDMREDEAAGKLCHSALAVFAANGIQPKAALCELLLVRLMIRSGQLEAAQTLCESGVQRAEIADSPSLACHLHSTIGQIYEFLQQPERARDSYQKAALLLESLRGELWEDDSKIAFLKDKLTVYESLVAVALRSAPCDADKRTAFLNIEKAKSRSLADLVARAAERGTLERQRTASDSVRQLREAVHWLSHRLEREQMSAAPAPQTIKALREEIRSMNSRLADALLRSRQPAGSGEWESIEGVLDIDAIRDALPADTTVLEYYECRGRILACVLDQRRLEIVDVAAAKAVRDRFRLLQFQFSKFRLGTEYVSTFSEQLARAIESNLESLHRDLIAPIRALLGRERLAIVPHGFLHQLPFPALSDGGTPLLEDFEISFAPSASILVWLLKKPRCFKGESLVMGVADPRAPHIQHEAATVAGILPNSRLLLGEAANMDSLRFAGRSSRYIHIAAHGYFHEDDPMFSSIRLGDSVLTLRDLYQLELSVELITLSGCGTGLNVVVGGDELLGLLRGLLQAGAQSMLVSLWDVDDATTTQFMATFYERLRSMTKSQALRSAALEIRNHQLHPYYWAPFVLVGSSC